MEREQILSAGIDIGTTTTHLIISRIGIRVTEGFGVVPRAEILSREILYQSPIYVTPLCENGWIDAEAVAQIIAGEYEKAGVKKTDLKSGAVIITGESSRRENAELVLKKVSELAGDFVAAQAGSELESYLAGRGAGADVLSSQTGKITANVDIGGGTTNISVFENGVCVEDSCLRIGGHLIYREPEGDACYVSPEIRSLCREAGIENLQGASEKNHGFLKLCDLLAELIKGALGFQTSLAEGTIARLLSLCVEDHLLSGKYVPELVTFSGGVAECMNRQKEDWCYGDMGMLLAKAIAKSLPSYPCEVRECESRNPIRATVIGAGNFSMEVSGSTIHLGQAQLPMKNLPCVGRLSEVGRTPCAICIPGERAPGFSYVDHLAEDIRQACQGLIEEKIPIVVLTKYDFSKALGQCLRRKLPRDYPFLCADGIVCRKGDYVDIGGPVGGSLAVPVVVKTLVFGGRA